MMSALRRWLAGLGSGERKALRTAHRIARTRHLPLAAFLLVLLILHPARLLALDDEATETATIPAGSYIVDMGVTAQTFANGLKPYGLVYDLVVNYRVPVLWSINSAKTKDGTDFTYNAKDYKGGPFIIRAEYVTTTVSNVIRNWKTLGVQVDGPIASAATSVPIYDTINSLAKLALDTDNGSIAADYLANAGIPSSAYSYKLPSALGSCDDIYVMPHADPTWSTHGNLVSFAQSGGYVWGACHAVGVLENVDDPGDVDTAPNMNFLSVNGLVDYGDHDDGSPPFTYNSSYDPAPVGQFMGILDSATQSGSQQIYLPATGGWRPTTKVYVYDPSQADVPSLSPGEAGVLVYGRAFGNTSYGRVMYEGGHDHNKSSGAANVAAQRAFLNFYFLSGIDRRVEPSASVPAVIVEQLATNISVSASGGSGGYTYNWSSSIGGTFGNSNSASTTFTPPDVPTNTPAVLTVVATDSCGRATVHTTNFTVQYIPTSDMSVTVTDSQDPVAASGSFNYVLSVVNGGGDPATNVVVRNTLPPGATYSTASGSGWSCNHSAGVVTCTRATLSTNVGSPSTITIGITSTNIAIMLTNIASVISTNFDHTMSNNTNSTTTTVINGIDLAITKTGSTNGYAGISLPYTLTVTNKTPSGVTNVIITDVLPATLDYGGASGSGWSAYYDAGLRQVTLILATLGSNAASTVTLSVIPNTNAVGTTVTNTATVTSATPDPDSSNNSSSQATAIAEAADLELHKTVLVDEGSNPDSFTYTVTLVNNGPATATNIVVTDVLTYITRPYYSNATATVGTFTPSGTPAGTTGGTWAITNLASGAEATLTLRYGTNSNSSFTNTASVTASQYDPDSSNNSDRAIGDKDFKQIDLGILKTDSPDPVGAGSNITYTITVTNVSTSDDWSGGSKTNTVVDTLPVGTTFVSASGTDWTCSHSSGVVTCFYTKDIKKHEAESFTIVVTAPSVPGTITNTATMSYVRPNTEDPNSANDSASAATTVTASVDLSVANSVNNSTPDIYSNVTFTVTVSNLRSNTANNVRITDALPSGLSYVSDAPSLGYYSSSDGYWYVGTLNVGASATLSLVAQVTSIGAKTNTATLSAVTQTDTNSANNSASAIVTPRYADLALAKTTSTTTPSVNSNVTFTITVTNLGPSVGTNLTISDVLPEYLNYVSHSAGSGTYTSGTGLWTIPTLASNATASLTLTARVGNWGWLTNTATVTGVTPADPVTANNTASVGVDGQLVDLDPSKTVDNARPLGIGSNLVFTIGVTNRGPSTASNLELTDVLPTGLGYVSSSASQGTYTPGTGKWAVGTLASNAYATLTLTATNSALGKFTNSVSITACSQTITNIDDDTPKVVIYSGGEADLYVTKYVDNDEPYQGDVVTFTVSLINYGPDSATGVIIRDVIPAGLTYLTNSAPAGTTYTTNAGDWTVGTITNGQTLELTISARVVGTGQIDNTAIVHASNASDSDPIGNSATATLNATPVADLIVFKSGTTNVYATSNLTYTITLTNAGLSSATNAILTDTLPAGATFVSASGGGSHSSGIVTWPTLAVFTNTATTNVTVTITAPVNGPLTNYASATSSTTDTNSANNNGSAAASRVITTVTPIADLVVAKSGATTVFATSNLTYTITVTNLGPNIATNLIVRDLLPTNVTFVSATSSGTNGNGTVWWPTMTNFAVGATTNFTVTITAPTNGVSLTNTVSGTNTTTDPDESNNNGSASAAKVITAVTPIADVKTTKAGATNVVAGSNLTYTITVTNLGPGMATNVVVSDLLPTNVVFVSASSGGTSNSGAVTWPTMTNFAVGATTNFTVTITAPTLGPLTNVVSSTASTTDPDVSNNDGSDSSARVITTVTTYSLAGTVFEDVNYGGGAGRSLSGSSGTARSGARVELYSASGAYVTFTNTDGSGAYTFGGLVPGTNYVRVVNGSVSSSRSGAGAGQIPVQTFRTDAGTGAAQAATDHVGGEVPSELDAPTNSSSTLAALNAVAGQEVQSLTTVSLTSSNLTGLDFGFNFNTIVNTNDTGQGSLRQFLVHANALANSGLAQSGLTAGIDNAIFMISDGTARAGMNTGFPNQFSSGVATIRPASALPAITDPVVLDATLQPGFSTTPIVELTGTGAGAVNGFNITAGGSTVRGWVINWFNQSGILLATAGGNTIQGNYLGTDATGTTAATNDQQGIYINGVSGNTIGGTTDAARNVISGNRLRGILVNGAGATTNVIQGNYVGLNAAGLAAVPNIIGIYIQDAPNNTVGSTAPGARNYVSGNSQIGIYLVNSGSTGNSVQGNTVGLNVSGSTVPNGSQGIDIITGAANNTIGGTATGAGNIISGNGNRGVRVTTGSGNLIQRNSIYGNTSLGLELGLSDGVTPNDGTVGSGANNGMDYPVFTSAALSNTVLYVSGYVGSTSNQAAFANATIELFKADDSPADQNGEVVSGDGRSAAHGEGRTYLGTITTDASGNFNTNLTVSGLAVGEAVTATASDASGNSSEFGANATVTFPLADVQTTKSGAASVYATSNLTYTITVTNLGPAGASNVIVSDLLPTNVTFVSASSGGTNGNGTVWWPTMTNFVVGATTNFTVIITAPTNGVSLTNIVSSTATSTDPDASNNDGSSVSAKVVTTVTPTADVKTTKSGATTVYATSNLTYTITVTNLGPGMATNVVVTDLLPTNVVFVSASSGGTSNSGAVTWPTMTNFALGATTNFTVTVTAPTGGSLTNTASSSATTTDPDASNNNGTASNARVVTSVTPVSDLKVTKSGAASVTAGSNLTYTITFTNLGPNAATNVVLTDTLPTNTTFVSASSGGSYSAGVVTWAALTNVTTTNFTVTLTAPGSGSLTNSAAGTCSTFDPDASNNDGSASNARVITTVTPSADVATTKSGPTSAAGTSNITYTITVTNHGPSTASNVVVIDTLPAGVAFVSASSGGTSNNGAVTWPTLTNFANAAFTNFTVVITLPVGGSVTNTVASTSDTGDPDASNNNGSSVSARVITTVATLFADVATSVSGPSSAAARTNITYTITVTNMGPGSASNVVVLDTLPAGVTFVSASSGGLESGGVVTWPTLTNFANAAATNFTVTVTTPDSGMITNTVSSTSDTSDPVAANNDGSSASGQVVTLILGVNVTGYVYLDANKNGFKDSGEVGTGLGLYAKVYATTNASGPALQAATVDGTSGAYTLTNIYRGTYMVLIDNNSTLSDVTPNLPAGWTGTEMPAHLRTNVAVAFVNVPNQNFGLIHSLGLAGRVFKDTGAGGGTANDGVMNGSESGLGGVTVRLTDNSGATVYDTATTDGSGNYTLLIPNAVANGATLKVTETNSPVHLSTGGSAGDTGGGYDRASDTVTFTYASGANYGGVNFGDVPDNSFVNDSQQAALPGSFVLHAHSFTAGSGGSVTFSVASLPNPSLTGWSQVIYRDANCNGALNPGEAILSGALAMAAGDKVCLLVKDFVPVTAPFNAQDQLTVTAAFTWTGASPALSTNTTRIGLTTVGSPTTSGLTLLKTVDKATALPGEVLVYTVTYANKSSSSLTNIIIFDQTPAFTTFTSAGYGALPASLTGIAVSAPSIGAAGAIKWTLTGNLAPASTSTVTFSVTVAQ